MRKNVLERKEYVNLFCGLTIERITYFMRDTLGDLKELSKPPKNAPKGPSSHRKFQQQRVIRK